DRLGDPALLPPGPLSGARLARALVARRRGAGPLRLRALERVHALLPRARAALPRRDARARPSALAVLEGESVAGPVPLVARLRLLGETAALFLGPLQPTVPRRALPVREQARERSAARPLDDPCEQAGRLSVVGLHGFVVADPAADGTGSVRC